jgi:hypothetical protein
MIKAMKKLFTNKKAGDPKKYTGFSDFFRHAPEEAKREVIKRAAQKANKDQLEVFRKANLKIKTS